MSEAVGRQVGNFFGSFLKYDLNNNTSIWHEFMRIRINVDVRKPLKRKKMIRKNASKFIVNCRYERLGDFCFRCGMLSHTERFCQKKFQQAGENEKEWGGWLRAQPRKMAEKSKWLREEGDDDWGDRYGTDSRNLYFTEDQRHGLREAGNQVRNNRGRGVEDAKLKEVVKFNSGFTHKVGEFLNGVISIGPSGEELDGLDLDERKRKRPGPVLSEIMDTTNNGLVHNDSALSKADCADSNNNLLATLANQASRPL